MKLKIFSILKFFKATPAEGGWFFSSSPKKEPFTGDTRLHNAISNALMRSYMAIKAGEKSYKSSECEKYIRHILKLIEKDKVDIEAQNEYGWTPLTLCVQGAHLTFYTPAILDIAKILINAGADVNRKDKFGSTALHDAVRFDNPDVVNLLLEAGADMNAKFSDYNNVIECAVSYGTPATIKALLEAGAVLAVTEKVIRNAKSNEKLKGSDVLSYLLAVEQQEKERRQKQKAAMYEALAWYRINENRRKEQVKEDVRTAIKEAKRELKKVDWPLF